MMIKVGDWVKVGLNVHNYRYWMMVNCFYAVSTPTPLHLHYRITNPVKCFSESWWCQVQEVYDKYYKISYPDFEGYRWKGRAIGGYGPTTTWIQHNSVLEIVSSQDVAVCADCGWLCQQQCFKYLEKVTCDYY